MKQTKHIMQQSISEFVFPVIFLGRNKEPQSPPGSSAGLPCRFQQEMVAGTIGTSEMDGVAKTGIFWTGVAIK